MDEYTNLTSLAGLRNKRLLFVALNTTTPLIESPTMGVTESTAVVIQPSGDHYKASRIINPENPISDISSMMTGIDEGITYNMPNWENVGLFFNEHRGADF